MTVPTDLDALAALAREATAGPWFHRQRGEFGADGTERDWIADHPERGQHHKIVVGRNSLHGGSPDYAYIAAANPAVVLGLIERVQRAEAKLEAIRDECDGKEDADDGIPNPAMRCMMIVEGKDKP